ncbi:DedA family protein [Pseudaeromonas sharmana]|uniref:DedA family protein n=1 Tax=Pseudaeromonas sharmana TaxID=328412 RepID=A0ABV8CJN2_9GAMM
MDILIALFTDYGYFAVFFILLICGFGVPIPEDITLVAGGIIAGLGFADVHLMFLVGMAGVLIGDGTMFTMGRIFGERIQQFPLFRRLLPPHRFAHVQEKFEKYGHWVLFIARFLPGLRSPIFITAGMSRRVSYLRFLLMDGFAALISVPLWVYLGYFGAYNRDWLMKWVERGQVSLLALAAVIILLVGGYYLRLYLRRRREDSTE